MSRTEPFFVTVVTRSTVDPDQPALRKRINYHNPASAEWLRKHVWHHMHNDASVTITPEGAT